MQLIIANTVVQVLSFSMRNQSNGFQVIETIKMYNVIQVCKSTAIICIRGTCTYLKQYTLQSQGKHVF